MKNNARQFLELIKSLKGLLDGLKEEKLHTIEAMKFASEGLPFVGYHPINELHLGISSLEKLLSIPNESFDFLKGLIKVEQIFKNSPSFPKFRHFVPDREIVYAEIDNLIDELENKSQELKNKERWKAYEKAHNIISSLRRLNTDLFIEKKIRYHEYKARAIEIIEQKRVGLDSHCGIKEILANLLILIATLGAAQLINKKVTGNLLFFTRTESAEKIDTLVNIIEDRAQYFPSTSKG